VGTQQLAKIIPLEGKAPLNRIDFIGNDERYLTVNLREQSYEDDTRSVNALCSWQQPTLIPSTLKSITGVTNIRGNMIRELHIRFAVAGISYTGMTVVMVLTKDNAELEQTMVLLVYVACGITNGQSSVIQNSQPYGECITDQIFNTPFSLEHNVVSVRVTGQQLILEEDVTDEQ
jgi:chemotaxis signal transduction protein